MLLRDRIPGHIDGLYGAEGQERLTNGVLLEFKADRSHIHSKKIYIVTLYKLITNYLKKPTRNQILSANKTSSENIDPQQLPK